MKLAATTQECVEETTNERMDVHPFGRLPDKWARDPRISAPSLVMLGYRVTWGDDRSDFGLYQDKLGKLIASGFCENVRSRAFRDLKALGIMDRPHNSLLPRTTDGEFARPVDKLIFPANIDSTNSRIVFRGWYDNTFSCGAMAVLLFMNAGTGKGARIYRREIEERFGWSKKTALKVLRELRRRWDPVARKALVEERKDRNQKNRIAGCHYVLNAHLLEPKLPDLLQDEDEIGSEGPMDFTPGYFQANRIQANRIQASHISADKRSIPLTEVSSPLRSEETPLERIITSHSTRFAAVGDESAARGPYQSQFVNATEVRPLRPERRVLKNWRTSPYFCEHEFRHHGESRPPLDLETWRFWLDRFGGAPAHVQTVAAHRQATEIAYELAAVSAETNSERNPAHWMIGLAYRITCDHEQGKDIYTLALSAEPMMRETIMGFTDWAYDVPLPEGEDFEISLRLAEMAARALESFGYGIKIDRDELFSAYRLDALRRMIAQHTWSGIVDAINFVTRNTIKQSEGERICGWDWFEDYIEPAKATSSLKEETC